MYTKVMSDKLISARNVTKLDKPDLAAAWSLVILFPGSSHVQVLFWFPSRSNLTHTINFIAEIFSQAPRPTGNYSQE